jgi:hypothetical protein
MTTNSPMAARHFGGPAFIVCILIFTLMQPAGISAQQSSTEITSFMSAGDFNADRDFAQVLEVEAWRALNGKWVFSVTIDHRDELLDDGSEHYADQWQVIDPRNNNVLATRVLTHSHINEMPFTRSMSGIEIPEELDSVIVRAGCTHHGFEGRRVRVPILQMGG